MACSIAVLKTEEARASMELPSMLGGHSVMLAQHSASVRHAHFKSHVTADLLYRAVGDTVVCSQLAYLSVAFIIHY